MCVLQQHELDALGEVVPGVARQELQSRRPARGDLEANAGRRNARRRNLGGSEAQEGVIYDKSSISFWPLTAEPSRPVTRDPPCRETSRK